MHLALEAMKTDFGAPSVLRRREARAVVSGAPKALTVEKAVPVVEPVPSAVEETRWVTQVRCARSPLCAGDPRIQRPLEHIVSSAGPPLIGCSPPAGRRGSCDVSA